MHNAPSEDSSVHWNIILIKMGVEICIRSCGWLHLSGILYLVECVPEKKKVIVIKEQAMFRVKTFKQWPVWH